MPEDAFFVPDLTQMGYPSSLAFPVRAPGTFITAGYQGTLGFAYPTALGVAAANPDRAVVSISGDGGFGWSLQELATAKRYGLAVAAVVFTDGFFGNVKLLQKRQFGRTYGAELQNPDFVRLAQAFGVDAVRATTPGALTGALASALAGRRPALIEVPVGEFPSPWHLLRNYAPGKNPPPPNPLGDPRT
jgi:acetolactate synthase-1/2/3 large subunit